jgi:hypothetical protein
MIINLTDDQRNRWNIHNKICCVYKIINTINGKIYIGQTVDLRRRVNGYLHVDRKVCNRRPIIKDINKYGDENFILDIIAECSIEDLNKIERENINLYDTTNPDKGYNCLKGNGDALLHDIQKSMKLKSIAHTGLKETANTKRKKSNHIIAIGEDHIIIADSGKLFGDYIGKGKDYIKNCLRQPSTVNGYFLYYDDYEKRLAIKIKMLSKRSIRNKRYMDLLEILNKYEFESVETIYSLLTEELGTIYELKYENINDNNELYLTKWEPTILENTGTI